ncbi:MAG TPA: divalent-cation tolerance protein CutA [Rhodospirillaceae bacterium]|nr:divalent-cation tolerance protein CutA [Rhodospirillaceae bacterium]
MHDLIYVTAANREAALVIARTLVRQRLVACANVIDGVTSVYWWDGKVNEGPEAVMVAKTRSDLTSAVIARIKEIHEYSCPCVVALEIRDGNQAFLDWINRETVQAP